MDNTPVIHPLPNLVAASQLPNKVFCPNNHVIGVAIREKQNEHMVTRLLVFIGALNLDDAVPNDAGRAKMDAGEVICGICGAVKVWHPGDYLLDRLLKGRKGRP